MCKHTPNDRDANTDNKRKIRSDNLPVRDLIFDIQAAAKISLQKADGTVFGDDGDGDAACLTEPITCAVE